MYIKKGKELANRLIFAPEGPCLSQKWNERGEHILTHTHTQLKTLHTRAHAHSQDPRSAASHKRPFRPDTYRNLKRTPKGFLALPGVPEGI